MKLWVNMTIVTLVATSVAAWADVDFNVFGFRPSEPVRKQPKRSYVTEILKNDIPSPAPLAAETRPKQKRARIHLASAITSDADQPVAIREPILLSNNDLVKPAPRPNPWNRVLVDALVAETGWHGAIRIRECDRAVEEKFAGGPPAVVECQIKDGDTVYLATTTRRDEDYRRRSNMWGIKH